MTKPDKDVHINPRLELLLVCVDIVYTKKLDLGLGLKSNNNIEFVTVNAELTGSANQTRDVTINIRAKQSQRDLIDLAAQAQGKSRSDFMLETACREAEAVLLDRRFFAVDEQTFNQFLEQLDAPPQGNEKLRALLQAKAPWD